MESSDSSRPFIDAKQVLSFCRIVDHDRREARCFMVIEIILRSVDSLEVRLDTRAFEYLP